MKYFIKNYLICILFLLSFFTNILSKKVTAEISCGELVDKITILTIKTQRIADQEKLKNIYTELYSLLQTYLDSIGNLPEVKNLQEQLQKINEMLWDIEDALRIKERNHEFDTEFIQLARNVYLTNDQRCEIKKKIDLLLGSHITEEKSYEKYVTPAGAEDLV